MILRYPIATKILTGVIHKYYFRFLLPNQLRDTLLKVREPPFAGNNKRNEIFLRIIFYIFHAISHSFTAIY